jgi:hypothetical protein
MEYRDEQWMAIVAELERLGGHIILMETDGDDGDSYATLDWQDESEGELCRVNDPDNLLAALRALPDGTPADEIVKAVTSSQPDEIEGDDDQDDEGEVEDKQYRFRLDWEMVGYGSTPEEALAWMLEDWGQQTHDLYDDLSDSMPPWREENEPDWHENDERKGDDEPPLVHEKPPTSIYLYRVVENDEDGDPYDFGVLRAADADAAFEIVADRLNDLGGRTWEVRLYPQKEVAVGIFEDAGNYIEREMDVREEEEDESEPEADE